MTQQELATHHSALTKRCIYKVLSLTVHRTVHDIEADSEADAIEMAQQLEAADVTGQIIGRTDVVTVIRPQGGCRHA